jgi:membrane protein DedA with SNARE-associated domain
MKDFFVGMICSVVVLSIIGSFVGANVEWLYSQDDITPRLIVIVFSAFSALGYSISEADKQAKKDNHTTINQL